MKNGVVKKDLFKKLILKLRLIKNWKKNSKIYCIQIWKTAQHFNACTLQKNKPFSFMPSYWVKNTQLWGGEWNVCIVLDVQILRISSAARSLFSRLISIFLDAVSLSKKKYVLRAARKTKEKLLNKGEEPDILSEDDQLPQVWNVPLMCH